MKKLLMVLSVFAASVSLMAQNFVPTYQEKEIFKNDDVVFRQIDEHTWEGNGHLMANESLYLIEGDSAAILLDAGSKIPGLRKIVENICHKPVRLIATHVHPDHTGSAVNEWDEIWINAGDMVSVPMMMPNYKGIIKYLTDGEIINLGHREIEVIFTPGHTPGSCTFLDKAKKYGFSGDSFGSGNLLILTNLNTVIGTCHKMSYLLITDYIAAVLHELRNKDMTSLLNDYAKFDTSLSERDHLAIRKTFSGMVKLLYPDLKMTDEEAYEWVDFAAEGRKRVKDQLYIIDDTFKAEPAKFKYINTKSNEEKIVETLERISNGMVNPASELRMEEATSEQNRNLTSPQNGSNNESVDGNMEIVKRPRIPILKEQSISFRMGQTAVSYQKLFGPYLQQANEITVEDPYIRAPWQIKNFMEFVTMLIDTRPVDDLKLTLITNEEDDKAPELIDKLSDIKDDLTEYSIEFNYKIRDFHDRCIKTDTGWDITLGRGLDIFEKYNHTLLHHHAKKRENAKSYNYFS